MGERIRVLIADDHAVVRNGLAKILGSETDIKIVGEAIDGREAINQALELKPDVILMDIQMPNCTGLEALVSIKQSLPGVRVLILSVSDAEEDLFQALLSGAQGYLLKSASIDEVIGAVRIIAEGKAILSPTAAAKLIVEFRQKYNNDKVKLSEREKEVLQLVADGLTNAEIANRLFISESTVRTHLQRLLVKLNLKTRAGAIAYASHHHMNIDQLILVG